MDDIFTFARGKISSDGSGLCIFRIRCADELPEVCYGVFFFQRDWNTFPGAHEVHEINKEWTLTVDGVEAAGCFFRESDHLQTKNPEAGLLNPTNDLPGNVFLNTIRFQYRQCSFYQWTSIVLLHEDVFEVIIVFGVRMLSWLLFCL